MALFGLSLDLPERKVVLKVCLSGLGERSVLTDSVDTLGDCDVGFLSGATPALEFLAQPLGLDGSACPGEEGERAGGAGLLGSVGRDSSEYVTAGMVPCPIDPLELCTLATTS